MLCDTIIQFSKWKLKWNENQVYVISRLTLATQIIQPLIPQGHIPRGVKGTIWEIMKGQIPPDTCNIGESRQLS